MLTFQKLEEKEELGGNVYYIFSKNTKKDSQVTGILQTRTAI
jgi:hypothetical protein